METTTTEAPVKDAATTDETPTTDAPTTETPADTGDEVKLSKADFEAMQSALRKANKEAETRRKELERIADEQAAAKETELAEQGKHQELAQKREKERDDARAEVQERDAKLSRYEEILGGNIEAQTKDWPEEVKALIPAGDGVDALARLEAVTKLSPLAEQLMDAPAKPGNGAGPTPGGIKPEDKEAARRAQAGALRRNF